MKIDLSEIAKRERFIATQQHSTLPLLIHNYTHMTQFERAWDEYTLQCRGLITDLEGDIVARPFRKFFNYGDQSAVIPLTTPLIHDKFDGSLGIQYYDGDDVCIATRGSFKSDQAKWATKWVREAGFFKEDFNSKLTYLWEIIYPENRIVVNYRGKTALVLLAVIDTETGTEEPLLFEQEASRLGVECSKHVSSRQTVDDFVKSIKALTSDQEGYVLHWPTEGNLRVKVKASEYVRLHRLVTEFSTKNIWECLMYKTPFDDVLTNVPDEFYDWVRSKKQELEATYDRAFSEIESAAFEVQSIEDPKARAAVVLDQYLHIQGFVFAFLKGHDFSEKLWRTLKPKWELPFKKDIDA